MSSIKLEVDLETGPAIDRERLNEAIGRIFILEGNSPADVPPPALPDIKGEHEFAVVGQMPEGSPIYRVGKGLQPPRAKRTPDPQYPPGLREKHLEGSATLRVVVDARGTVHSIQVEKTDKPGFELASAEAVKDWTFQPATLNGKPVAVVIHIEVNFRLR